MEERMRYGALLLLVASLYPYYPAYAQGSPPPGYYAPGQPPPPPYARGAGPRSGPQAYNTENCGTPDEPKPCPPMPRNPLPYYPANKQ
jgi:hypothetical protein